LTSAACTPTNPGCKIPDLNNPKAHGGYGVFGAGLTGAMPVRSAILSLPAPLSSSYSIRLTTTRGELVLGGRDSSDAVKFHLTPANKPDVKWTFPQGCLFVNGKPAGSCLSISFDTGNGVPWIRENDASALPQEGGDVTPGNPDRLRAARRDRRGNVGGSRSCAGRTESRYRRPEALP